MRRQTVTINWSDDLPLAHRCAAFVAADRLRLLPPHHPAQMRPQPVFVRPLAALRRLPAAVAGEARNAVPSQMLHPAQAVDRLRVDGEHVDIAERSTALVATAGRQPGLSPPALDRLGLHRRTD